MKSAQLRVQKSLSLSFSQKKLCVSVVNLALPLLPLQRDLVIHPHTDLTYRDIPYLTDRVDASVSSRRPASVSGSF